MSKVEMAHRLADRTGLSKSVAKEAVDGIFADIGDALANGEEMRIAGFGSFGTRSRPARTGRNPRTGEAVSISASTSPTFKAGKTLKDVVNASPGSRRCNPGRRRVVTTQTAPMWNSADCNAMTGTLQAAGTAPRNPRIAVGLTAGLLPVWMLQRV